MSAIVLSSPMRGWIVSLDEVPDEVFSSRMLGDGVAIEPTGSSLHAPCDGEILSLHASGHAITLRTEEGAELLIHIGVDTVSLAGKGFRPTVSPGDRVAGGDVMIEFDLELLLREAAAVTTSILVNNPDRFSIEWRDTDRPILVGERLMTLAAREPQDSDAVVVGDDHRRAVDVPMIHGIHARPAGRIAECARQFVSDITLSAGGRSGNARSAVSLLTLGVKCGDQIEVCASGADAKEALAEICALILGGMGERGETERPLATGTEAIANPLPRPIREGFVFGIQASPGMAIGKAFWLRRDDQDVAEDGRSPEDERLRLASALEAASSRLAGASGSAASVVEAHRALIQDPELRASAERAISRGRSAGFAWRSAIRESAALLANSGDARLAERADDLLDVERQVITILLGREDPKISVPANAILLANDLLPSELIQLGPEAISGFCTVRGGPTSHVAILAASMNIPGLVATGVALTTISDGAELILNAEAANVRVGPDANELDMAKSAIEQKAARLVEARAQSHEPALTTDGTPIDVFANVGSVADAKKALEFGAGGCGLLRTEFLFVDRPDAPSELEQADEYQKVADALDGRPLIIRLLDVGGDKPASYLPARSEENPALGLRGIRVGLEYRDILQTQLRAILRVRPVGQCKIMIPMISSLSEFAEVEQSLSAARSAIGHIGTIELGVMVETPAAAVTADLIASRADFMSIGTNDLTQYVLAMDRGNPAVAPGVDPMHPAVLRMIAQTCQGAGANSKWVGVCGGLASDTLAAPILLGLGVRELSVVPAAIPEVKAAVRTVSLADCRAIASDALIKGSPEEVRELARRFQKGQR